jgi:hypothetical protein
VVKILRLNDEYSIVFGRYFGSDISGIDVTDCVAIEKTGPRIESRERRFTRHQDQRTCCRLPYFVFVSANSDLCTVGIPQPF